MPWDEKDVYQHRMAQTRARFIGSIVFAALLALVAIIFILANRPESPPTPPKVTAEGCKDICGVDGVLSFDDEKCQCKRPEKTKLNCVCE